MRLLRNDTFELHNFTDEGKIPKYAILSHTWLRPEEGEEVLFADMDDISAARLKRGWKKLEFATRQATLDGLDFVWIDTCCIDKSSSAELSESINSMYRWYKKSEVCYVHLDEPPNSCNAIATNETDEAGDSDAETSRTPHRGASIEGIMSARPHHDMDSEQQGHELQTMVAACDELVPTAKDLGKLAQCRWFTRGWTLQEMIASRRVVFFDQPGDTVGTLDELADSVATVTGVHQDLLKRRRPITSFSIAQKMNWASKRITTRAEDRAYSLLGIFDISLAVIYGEGERAFQRLQEELLRVYSDHTIFAWGYEPRPEVPPADYGTTSPNPSLELLARSPDDFTDQICSTMIPSRRGELQREYEVLGRCINFDLPVLGAPKTGDLTQKPQWKAVLNCCFEDVPTRHIVLHLHRNRSGDFVRRSVDDCDIYDAAQDSRSCSLTILRRPDDAQTFEDVINQHDLYERFMFRCNHVKSRDPTLQIISGEGSIIINPNRKDLPLTTLSVNIWDEKNHWLIVPRYGPEDFSWESIDNSDDVPYILMAKLTLQSGSYFPKLTPESGSYIQSLPVFIKITPGILRDSHGRISGYAFGSKSTILIEFGKRSGTLLGVPLFRHTVMIKHGRPLTANIKIEQLLSEQYNLIEFEVRSRLQLPYLFFGDLVSYLYHGVLIMLSPFYFNMNPCYVIVYVVAVGGILATTLAVKIRILDDPQMSDIGKSAGRKLIAALDTVLGFVILYTTYRLVRGMDS